MTSQNLIHISRRASWLASTALFLSQSCSYGQANGPCISPGLAMTAVPEPSPVIIAVALLGFGAYFRRR